MSDILDFCNKVAFLQKFTQLKKRITNSSDLIYNSFDNGSGFNILSSLHGFPIFGISTNNSLHQLKNRMDTTNNRVHTYWRRSNGIEMCIENNDNIILPDWDGSNEHEIFFTSNLITPDARSMTIISILKNLNPKINTIVVNLMNDENFVQSNLILDEAIEWVSKFTEVKEWILKHTPT